MDMSTTFTRFREFIDPIFENRPDMVLVSYEPSMGSLVIVPLNYTAHPLGLQEFLYQQTDDSPFFSMGHSERNLDIQLSEIFEYGVKSDIPVHYGAAKTKLIRLGETESKKVVWEMTDDMFEIAKHETLADIFSLPWRNVHEYGMTGQDAHYALHHEPADLKKYTKYLAVNVIKFIAPIKEYQKQIDAKKVMQHTLPAWETLIGTADETVVLTAYKEGNLRPDPSSGTIGVHRIGHSLIVTPLNSDYDSTHAKVKHIYMNPDLESFPFTLLPSSNESLYIR
jgi:hypothetical protein